MKKFIPSRFTMQPLAAFILTLCTANCGTPLKEKSHPKIFGGTKTPVGAWLNVVAITEKNNGIFCSGTAIHPKLVITAAHCARGMNAENIAVYKGQGKVDGDLEGQYAVSRLQVSPLYKPWDAGNDIAYLLLKTPLDLPAKAFTPVLTNSAEMSELLAIGKPGLIIGYGARENNQYGEKYQVFANITEVDKLEVTIGGQGKDSCYGDSGGPVFGALANGEWRVYGVTSRGDECGTGGIYGLMHANICWIQANSGLDLNLASGTCP